MKEFLAFLSEGGPKPRNVAILVTAMTLGFAGGATVSGYGQLPAQVAANSARIRHVEDGLDSLRRDVAELRRSDQAQLCLQIAERRGTEWQACLGHGQNAR